MRLIQDEQPGMKMTTCPGLGPPGWYNPDHVANQDCIFTNGFIPQTFCDIFLTWKSDLGFEKLVPHMVQQEAEACIISWETPRAISKR